MYMYMYMYMYQFPRSPTLETHSRTHKLFVRPQHGSRPQTKTRTSPIFILPNGCSDRRRGAPATLALAPHSSERKHQKKYFQRQAKRARHRPPGKSLPSDPKRRPKRLGSDPPKGAPALSTCCQIWLPFRRGPGAMAGSAG